MADAKTYYQQNLEDIIGGTMPEFKRARGQQYDFLVQNALRTGQSAAAAATVARPYADAAGTAAAEAGVQAKRLATQQEQFDVGQANWEKSFEQGQANWEKAMAVQEKQQNTANMIKMFEQTGWTQELLDSMGYDKESAGGTQFNRMLDDLGFSQPEGVSGDSGDLKPGVVPGPGNDYGYWDISKA